MNIKKISDLYSEITGVFHPLRHSSEYIHTLHQQQSHASIERNSMTQVTSSPNMRSPQTTSLAIDFDDMDELSKRSEFIITITEEESVCTLPQKNFPQVSAWVEQSKQLYSHFSNNRHKEVIESLPSITPSEIACLSQKQKIELYQMAINFSHAYYMYERRINEDLKDFAPTDRHKTVNDVLKILSADSLPSVRTNVSDFLAIHIDPSLQISFPFSLFSGMPEHDLVYGTHALLEIKFNKALNGMISICDHIQSQSKPDFSYINYRILTIAHAITQMTAALDLWSMYMHPTCVDNTLWARTALKHSSKVYAGELGSSGEDNPFIHAFDHFFFPDFCAKRNIRKENMLKVHQSLLDKLKSCDFKNLYLANTSDIGNMRLLLVYYKAFLKKHMTKAVGGVGITQSTGRSQTNSGKGARQSLSIEQIVGGYLTGAIVRRFQAYENHFHEGIRSKVLNTIKIQSMNATLLTLGLYYNLPIISGDLIEVFNQSGGGSKYFSILDYKKVGRHTWLQVLVTGDTHFIDKNSDGTKTCQLAHRVNSFYHRRNSSQPGIFFSQGTGISSNACHINQGGNRNDVHFISLRSQLDLALMNYIPMHRGTWLIWLTQDQKLYQYQDGVKSEIKTIGMSKRARLNDLICANPNLLPQPVSDYGIFVCGSSKFRNALRETMERVTVIDERFWHESIYEKRSESYNFVSPFEGLLISPSRDRFETDGNIYDMRSFSLTHPGGKKVINLYSNLLGNRAFSQVHGNDQKAFGVLNGTFIGRISPEYIKPDIGPPTKDQFIIQVLNTINNFLNTVRVNLEFTEGKIISGIVANDIMHSLVNIYLGDMVAKLYTLNNHSQEQIELLVQGWVKPLNQKLAQKYFSFNDYHRWLNRLSLAIHQDLDVVKCDIVRRKSISDDDIKLIKTVLNKLVDEHLN